MAHRLARISQHLIGAGSESVGLAPQSTASMSAADKSDDDVVICAALRTAITKAKKGLFRNTTSEDMLAALFKALVDKTKIDPSLIGDAQIGNVLMPGAAALAARQGQLMGGMPASVPLMTINRQCSSGLQTVANVAANIKAGTIDIGIAGGVESMSMFSMMDSVDPSKISEKVFDTPSAAECMTPMGITSENVAEKYGISRERQDAMAAESHAKAAAAIKGGLMKDEIVPVKTIVKEKDGSEKEITVDTDEGAREGTTVASLGALKPAFKKGGSTTVASASQVSDGAALVLLARRSKAKELGLPIVARIRSYAVVGVDPSVMGIGPAFAIPEALKKAGLTA